MKKIQLNANAFDKKTFPIVRKLFETSLQKNKTVTMKNITAFVKKYKDVIAEKINYLRDFSFQSIDLYKVPRVMESTEVDVLHDVMENAQKFLIRVREKFDELQMQQLAA